ncbi:hypothetical protein X975_08171, partial [Stegodyphus mimosarum]
MTIKTFASQDIRRLKALLSLSKNSATALFISSTISTLDGEEDFMLLHLPWIHFFPDPQVLPSNAG